MKYNVILGSNRLSPALVREFSAVKGFLRGHDPKTVGAYSDLIMCYPVDGSHPISCKAPDGNGVLYKVHPGDFIGVRSCSQGTFHLDSYRVEHVTDDVVYAIPAQL